MSTNNSWNNAIAAANSAITLNSGTNTVSISTDAAATTINIGTGAAVKATTLGSTNSTSSLTLNSGSGGIKALGVSGVSVSNKNYVKINTSTGALGSDTVPNDSLILIQTQTTAGAATIDFTTGISSTYLSYLVLFRQIKAATGTPAFYMLFSTNGGSSWLNSGYTSGYNGTAYNSATWGNGNSTTQCRLGGLSTTSLYGGYMYIHNLGGSTVVTYNGRAFENNNQTDITFGTNSNTGVNALRFQTQSGNIVGSISLYGIAN